MRIVFDPDGRVRDPYSWQFAAHLVSSIEGKALAEYVVRNMGYVALDAFAQSAHVRVRPAIATANALHACLDWLTKTQIERVVMSSFVDDWQHNLLQAPYAVRAISRILQERAGAESSPRRSNG